MIEAERVGSSAQSTGKAFLGRIDYLTLPTGKTSWLSLSIQLRINTYIAPSPPFFLPMMPSIETAERQERASAVVESCFSRYVKTWPSSKTNSWGLLCPETGDHTGAY